MVTAVWCVIGVRAKCKIFLDLNFDNFEFFIFF
jgi:hypothetical protein